MAGRVKHNTAGAVSYRKRQPRRRKRIEFDRDLANELLTRSNGNELPAIGKCHDCSRPVSGERRYCGPCLAKH